MNTGVLQLFEQCQSLQEQSVTLLHEMYLVKTYLLTFEQRQYYFKDNDFGKFRSKIEKKFPALPDFTKVSSNYGNYRVMNLIVTNSDYAVDGELRDLLRPSQSHQRRLRLSLRSL